VGWQTREAWLAIPAHVLYGDRVAPNETRIKETAGKLRIMFAGDSVARALCPRVQTPNNLTPPSLDLDIAFVCIVWEGRPLFWSSMSVRQLTPSAELLLMDPDSGSNVTGTISQISKGLIRAQNLIGDAGMSGAPVASVGGIVGLYLGHDDQGRIANLSAIHSLSRDAQVPWELSDHEFYDCRLTRRVCVTGSRERLLPASVTFMNAKRTSYEIAIGGCNELPEDKYSTTDPTGSLVCEPSIVSIHANASPLSIPLGCSPNFTGTWLTEDGNAMTCVATIPVGAGAQCSGLQGLGWGILQAVVTGDAMGYLLGGSFYDSFGNARKATGRFEWHAGRLSGELQRDGEPVRRLVFTKKIDR